MRGVSAGSVVAMSARSTVAYLAEDHGRDLLRRESLGLAEVLDLDHGGVASGDDLEGP